MAYHALTYFVQSKFFSVFITVNMNSLNTNRVTKWWKTKLLMSLCCFLFNFWSVTCLNYWNQVFHFNKRIALHSGLVLVIVVLILVPPKILCLNSETCVLAETEASNSRAWIAVTSGDNTGGGGLAWGSIPTCADCSPYQIVPTPKVMPKV